MSKSNKLKCGCIGNCPFYKAPLTLRSKPIKIPGFIFLFLGLTSACSASANLDQPINGQSPIVAMAGYLMMAAALFAVGAYGSLSNRIVGLNALQNPALAAQHQYYVD